ncbi:beta-ketoacyl-[acyl-carrier-protein] synthase family protein [Halomonas sp. SH5A2]|uniref:beta-ketoacyl-[acyl-carrier-protein] synthase family protein n=1 Tax=Halomonas sp. SH5A2 TaxID=2749040 RepID=UPI00163FCAC3|nr:beta-ketoacyl-[acyl-carrier-protein] synthase family protein [Halomonas sp. SH5A2]QNI04354.1 beta-ketoacyl-[acyl-carrier-protein] synthase family protein [Halomonas sp. SH5A2]
MPSQLTPLQAQPCRLLPPALVCPLGDDLATIADALFNGRRGLVRDDTFSPGRPLPLGRVTCVLPDADSLPMAHRSRNNQLLAAALKQLEPTIDAFRKRHPEARIGVVLGTSTSGIGETEIALAQRQQLGDWPEDFRYQRHEIGSSACFVAERLGLDGPAYTLSTACTSSARALASAKRLLASGSCDAVIAGGADSLCSLTVNGFASLEALSDSPCQPFSANRDGINLGEAAALFLVTGETGGIQLSGYGETSDAYHISAPHPDGTGAIAAMQAALTMARLSAADIDYLNLHGTATRQNDSMEALAVNHVFGDTLPCSSTKALTGHTLGACGALEAAFCWLTLDAGRLPPHVHDGQLDPALPPLTYAAAVKRDCRRALSNAFAFGGNNIALLLERVDD